ncbi:MAG: 4-hydroxy-tetrahydrodipicolinate synthase [Gemmatimonadales bacterium]
MTRTWQGTFTAIVTPFSRDGSFDETALRTLVDRQIEGGVDGLVPCGTTGESATMSTEEKIRVIEIVREQSNDRVRVLAGAGGNSTAAVVTLAKQIDQVSVDGILIVVPYYNKPTQEGLYQHFATVADAVEAPVVMYNVPGRTSANMTAETALRLAEHGNIAGTKEASGALTQVMEIIRGAPSGFSILSGDDNLAVPIIALGGHGVVSVASNEAPAMMSKMVRSALEGKMTEARELHYKLLGLMNVNFIETNPIPVKAALAMMGLIEEQYRLPLVPMAEANREKLHLELMKLNLVAAP